MTDLALDPTTLTALGVAAAVVVLGLVVYGFRDLRRFSVVRVLAVASVAFREGVRRRVLWVAPLAVLATLALVGLARPEDEADAVRQAAASVLFASGLVAVLVPLVLGCTSLPREVESKVVFTVVTKPLTRLELLLGKLAGFAALSAVVLGILGAFGYGLLLWQERAVIAGIEDQLGRELLAPSRAPYLRHLADDGLLRADEVDPGDDLQVYGQPPAPGEADDAVRWAFGGRYYAVIPFEVPRDEAEDLLADAGDLLLAARVRPAWRLLPGRLPPGSPPLGIANLDNLPEPDPPAVNVSVLDALGYDLVPPAAVEGNSVVLPPSPDVPFDQAPGVRLPADATRATAERLISDGRVYLGVQGLRGDYLYGYGPYVAELRVVRPDGEVVRRYAPTLGQDPRSAVLLRTYVGAGSGVGLDGPNDRLPAPTAVLAYRGGPAPPAGDDGTVGVELFVDVERTGGVLDEGDVTRLEMQVVNADTGYESPARVVEPETGRGVYVEFPAEAFAGGDYDLRLRTLSRGHVVTVRPHRVRVVIDSRPYAANLLMALAGLWLLSVLVAASGLAFSTFVSWPIALVLTVCVLSGRWVGDQLGAAFDDQLGRAIVRDYAAEADAAAQEVVETGFNAVGAALDSVTRFLPTLAYYDAADDVEAGRAVSWSRLGLAAGVTVVFGLPLLTIGYVVLRNREVAP